jgi:hypothetical protein
MADGENELKICSTRKIERRMVVDGDETVERRQIDIPRFFIVGGDDTLPILILRKDLAIFTATVWNSVAVLRLMY